MEIKMTKKQPPAISSSLCQVMLLDCLSSSLCKRKAFGHNQIQWADRYAHRTRAVTRGLLQRFAVIVTISLKKECIQ